MSDRTVQLKFPNLPLRLILISQFVFLILGISGVMTWLLWRSEQDSIASLVGQLQDEISDRIEQKLRAYLETPHLINQINSDALLRGDFQAQGAATERYLWQQIKSFPTISWIYYGGAKPGEFIGITRTDHGRSLILSVNPNGFQSHYYLLDSQGYRFELARKPNYYDAQKRPWYKSALASRKPAWSPIYPDSFLPQQVLTASLSVYNSQNQRLGVFGADLSLEDISRFLSRLKIGKTGTAVIFERSGLIVASSASEKPYQIGQDPQRLSISESRSPLIRGAAAYLAQKFGNFEQIQTGQHFEFLWNQERHFLKILPYRDNRGINWLIAVVMPEADFLEHVKEHQNLTVFLLGLALLIAIGLGVLTTSYINNPLRRLTLASQALANGDLERDVPGTGISELNILSGSFNQMAIQLRQSFKELENINEELEKRVQDRTRELQTSEEIFSKVFSASPYPIMISNRPEKRVLAVNESYLKFSEYTAEELVGKYILELPVGFDLQDLGYISHLLDEYGSFSNLELNYRKKSQRIGTTLISAELIELNGETCVLSVYNDITERKEVQAALSHSEERFRTLVANIPGVVYRCACDSNRTMEFLGGNVEAVTGYPGQDFIQNQVRSWASIIYSDDQEIVQRCVYEGISHQQPYLVEYRIVDACGQIRWLYEKGRGVLANDGTILWLDGAMFDISDRKQAEQDLQEAKQSAESASVAKGHFLASMSHELRTPLNAILGFTQLMARDESIQPTQRNYLNIIQNSGEHLLQLINDVLDLSKIEAGRMPLHETSFDLYELLTVLESMFRLKATAKNLQLRVERSPEVPQGIIADEVKLRQILINLLNNALKFTPNGGVRLSVNRLDPLTEGVKSNAEILLSFVVADTGVGIPQTQLEQIFEAFEQTEAGRQAPEGTGLGLSICRKFTSLMRGSLTITSELGQGSTFQLTLPIKQFEADSRIPPSSNRRVIGLAPDQPEYRILVVEDRWESRYLLVKLLEDTGFQVREAQNGAEAVDVWRQWQPHLIWMDMRMPVLDGYEATQQIKSDLSGQATIIIALTASALEDEQSAILSAGCDDFVHKPFQETTIFAKLSEYLGVSYQYQALEPSSLQESSDSRLSVAELQHYFSIMSSAWIADLYHAATLADNDLLAELIQKIPAEHPAFSQALTNLIDDFDYNQMITLSQHHLESH
jgi:PAS domain S-box-containing protein